MAMYLCPVLVCVTQFLVNYVVVYGAGERGFSDLQLAWLRAGFMAAYTIGGLGMAPLVTERNARRIVVVGLAVALAASLGALALVARGGFLPLLGLFALTGLCYPAFFVGFQVLMRQAGVGGDMGRVTGLYTIAWAGGGSLGVLSGGAVYRLGLLPMGLLTTLAIGGSIAVLLLVARPAAAAPHPAAPPPPPTPAPPAAPWYVPIGWLMIVTVVFVEQPFYTYFPAECARDGISAWMTSLPLFAHLALISSTAWGHRWLHRAMYRPGVLLCVHLGAAALLLVLGQVGGYALNLASQALLGSWGCFCFFSAVYYSGNSNRRGFNISINECLVGAGNAASAFLGQVWMAQGGLRATYFWIAAIVVLSLALQLGFAALSARRVRLAPPALPEPAA